ncbi:potassium voltage-gated channel subfamily C member 3-like [Lineus longissimus]|uniref:potassium voltage-gated channel subfamily C member 3-like n=1 Tax=Lineus longissimus TaxID=88925 RepID=UPI00315CA0DC
MDLIKINISGTVFVTTREIILNIPTSKLASALDCKRDFDNSLGALYFPRSPDLFTSVLEAHRQGTLHVPSDACGIEFLNEMEFWNLPKSMISPCCIGKINSALEEKEITETIKMEIMGNFVKSVEAMERRTGWKQSAARLWLFLEFPVYSTAAKVYSIFIALWILVSVFNFMFVLDMNLRAPLKANATQMAEQDQVVSLIQSDKWQLYWFSAIPFSVMIIDYLSNFVLLIDCVTRVIVCPYRMIFLKSLKIVDIMVMMGFMLSVLIYLPVMMTGVNPNTALKSALLACTLLQLTRPLLLLRLSNTFVGLRVMMMVLTKSMTELFTIISFLVIGMMLFGVFIFAAEIGVQGSFNSPWDGAWWALITMSTVGYGDMYPHGWPGYIVAISCAVMGLIITAMSIPIISNNFNVYYDNVRLVIGVIQERCKELREKKKRNSIEPIVLTD